MPQEILEAAKAGDSERVRVLVAGGASMDAADSGWRSAAWWAAHNGHAEVVRVLGTLGARVGAPDAQEETPEQAAERRGHRAVCALLRELATGRALLDAAQAGNTAAVHALLSARDAMLARRVGEPGDVSVDLLSFNERTDEIGHGRYGHVFRCRLGEEEELLAVKRVERLRFEQMGGRKEVNVLLHVQIWRATRFFVKHRAAVPVFLAALPARTFADSQAPCAFEATSVPCV